MGLSLDLFDPTGTKFGDRLKGTSGEAHVRLASSFDPVEGVTQIAMLVWDTGTLDWVKFSGSAGGVTADVTVLNFPAKQQVYETFINNVDYNYIGVAYPSATQETYTFKSGGAGGSTVRVITVDYTDSTKASLSAVTRTT